MVRLLRRAIQRDLLRLKLKRYISFKSAVPLLGILIGSEKRLAHITHNGVCAAMFVAALLALGKLGHSPNVP